jgi:lysozyme
VAWDADSTAVDLVMHFEGCPLTAYKKTNDVWTIGWGHTGLDVHDGLVWTQDQADAHLIGDMGDAETLLLRYSPGPFVAGAEQALIDFVYNLGIGNYRTSTLCALVNGQQWPTVKTELLKWDHQAGVVLEGLLARRQAEADMIRVGSG